MTKRRATSAADIFTQLGLHEVDHRAQVTYMLTHLGVGLRISITSC